MNQAELEIKNKLRDLKKDWNRYTRIWTRIRKFNKFKHKL